MSDGFFLVVQDDAQVVRQGLQSLGANIPTVGRLGIYRSVQRMATALHNDTEAPSVRPVHWDTIRQQKKYFASDGFGRGIPTERSGNTKAAWTIIELDNGYSLYNPTDAALHVYGDIDGKGQSRIHEGRQKLFSDTVAEGLFDGKLPDDVVRELRIYTANLGLEMT